MSPILFRTISTLDIKVIENYIFLNFSKLQIFITYFEVSHHLHIIYISINTRTTFIFMQYNLKREMQDFFMEV